VRPDQCIDGLGHQQNYGSLYEIGSGIKLVNFQCTPKSNEKCLHKALHRGTWTNLVCVLTDSDTHDSNAAVSVTPCASAVLRVAE